MGQVASHNAAFAQVTSKCVAQTLSTDDNQCSGPRYLRATAADKSGAGPHEVNLVECEAVSIHSRSLPKPDDDVVMVEALSVVPAEGTPNLTKDEAEDLQQRLVEQTGAQPRQIQIDVASDKSFNVLVCNSRLVEAMTALKGKPSDAEQAPSDKNQYKPVSFPSARNNCTGGLTCTPPASYGGVPRSRHLATRTSSTVLKCETTKLCRGQAVQIEYEVAEPLIAQLHELVGGGLPLGPNPVIALVPQRFAPRTSPALLQGALALRCIDVAASSGQVDFFVPEAEGPRSEKCELRIYALIDPDGACHQVGSALACDVLATMEPLAIAERIVDTFKHDAILQKEFPNASVECCEVVVAKRSELAALQLRLLESPDFPMDSLHTPPVQTVMKRIENVPHLFLTWPELTGPPASNRSEVQCAMVDQKSGELLGSLLIEANANNPAKLPLPSGLYVFRAHAKGRSEWGVWSSPTLIASVNQATSSLSAHHHTTLAPACAAKTLEFHELRLPGGAPKRQGTAQAEQALTAEVKAVTEKLQSMDLRANIVNPDALEDAVEEAWDLTRSPHLASLKGGLVHEFRTALRDCTAALQSTARTEPTRFVSREARWGPHERCQSPSTPRPSRQRKMPAFEEKSKLALDAANYISSTLSQLASSGYPCSIEEISQIIMESWSKIQHADLADLGSHYPLWSEITDEGGVEKIVHWVALHDAEASSLNALFELLRKAENALHALRRLRHAANTLAWGRPGGTLALPKEALKGRTVNEAVEHALKAAHAVGITDSHPLCQRAKAQLYNADEYGTTLPSYLKTELTATTAHCRATGHPEALDLLVQRANDGGYTDTDKDHRVSTACDVAHTLHRLDAAVSSRLSARSREKEAEAKKIIRGSGLEAKSELRSVLTAAEKHGIKEGHVRLSRAKHLLHEPVTKEELTRTLNVAISKFDTGAILHQFYRAERFALDMTLPELRWARRTFDAADHVFHHMLEHGPNPKSLKARKELDAAFLGALDAGISKAYLNDVQAAFDSMRFDNTSTIRFPMMPAPLHQAQAAAESARALGVPEKYIRIHG